MLAPEAGRRRLPLVTSTPPLASRARDVDRRTRPFYAVWELTLRCDLHCRHCSSRAGKSRADELTTEEALDLVAQLADLGVEEVTLIGGEAYLREDWLLVVSAMRARGMRCTLVTGGRHFDAARARAARDAGVQSVSVSIDGLEPTHDALRGAGSFGAATEAMANVRAAGMQLTANTQITRTNRREIPPLFHRLVEERIAAWQPQITVAMGRAADDPELLLEPFHLLEVIPMLARLAHEAQRAGVVFWAGNNVGYFGPHEATLRACSPRAHRGACGAGRAAIGVESNGVIKGCPSLPTNVYSGGDVRARRLVDIWERAEALRFTRDRTVDELWGRCRGCYHAEECLAGCSWTAHSILGRRGNNPYCHHRALRLLREGVRERVVRRSAPAGASFDLGVFDLVEEPWPAGARGRAEAVARGEEEWLLEE